GKLPPVLGNFPNHSTSQGTVFYYLLPHLEQDTVYRNSTVNGVPDANNPVAGTNPPVRAFGVVVPVYLCPADPSAPAGNSRQTGATSLTTVATANYAANPNVFKVGAGIPRTFQNNGTSNTITYTEHYQICDGNWFYWGVTQPPKPPQFAVPAQGLPFQLAPPVSGGNPACDTTLASSPHGGGMLVALGDGAVRTVSSGMSLLTFRRACDPTNPIPLGPDWSE